MVPFVWSVATRWVTRATSRGTVPLAIPALLVVASLFVGGWELLRRTSRGGPPPATTTAPGDTSVVFGPQRFDAPLAKRGDSAAIVSRFPTEITLSLVPLHRYVVRVTNGDPDGTGRVSSATVDGHKIDWETGVVTFDLAARATMVLDITINAQPTAGHVTLEVLDVSGGGVLVFGMERLNRESGPAVSFTRSFTVDDEAGAPFYLWVVNGAPDGTGRLSGVPVSLNGTLVHPPLALSRATTMTAVTPVPGLNALQIVLPEAAPGFVEIGVSGSDISPPILTIATPAPGLITRDSTLTVSGTVTDGSPVAVTVNGRTAARTGTGFSIAVPLTEGSNTLLIAAVDAAGARTDSSRVVIGDRTAPTLTVTAPGEAFVTDQASISVTGTVREATPGVTVNANGVPLPVHPAGAFAGTVALAAGAHVISITAADAAGNATTVVRTGTRSAGLVAIDGVVASLQDDDVLASDAFTRANETPLAGTWTATGLNLSSNQVVPASLGTGGIAYYSDLTWPDNQFSRAALSVTGSDGEGEGAGLVVRRSASANTHYRVVVDHAGADNVTLERRLAGTDTILAQFTESWSDGDVWELRATGITLKIYRNGAQVGTTVRDESIASGSPGLAYAATTSAASIDDWEGGSPAPWAHEPAGFVAIKSTDFTALPGDGWVTTGATIVTDSTAPLSSTYQVMQWEYDTLLYAGTAPGTTYDADFPYAVGEYFVGFHFKFSDPFDISEIGTSIWTPLGANFVNYTVGIRADSSIVFQVATPEPQGGVYNLYPNVTDPKITFGAWHKFEHYFKPASSPTAADGILRWWIDGVLCGDYTDIMWPDPEFVWEVLQYWPGWGGYPADHPAFTGYLSVDHTYLSRPRGGLPPDPVTVAPPINQTTATSLATSTEFLYTGAHPIQTGVAPGTIEPLRVAVLRGRVRDRAEAPLSGVTITVKDHPELGQTLSRTDGRFDLAVNGGGVLTLDYARASYLPAQRQVAAPWQDFAIVDDVVLVQLDTAVTTIAFEDTIEVARGSVVADTDGTRQATLLFLPGTTAQMVLPNGDTIPLTSMQVRATEYTVGPNGPQAMPAVLPPTSAYTYAVELSADEALAAGATVQFSQPVVAYVENFIEFPVGVTVPVGSYDRVKGIWVPEPNGRVIKILSIAGDTASLDIDGDAEADDSTELAALGITPAERVKLADLYSAELSLWRTPITHLTPYDLNLPSDWPDPPDDPRYDGGGDARRRAAQVDDPCVNPSNSVIECQNQVLGETIGLVGTPFTLNYRSNRVPGFDAAMAMDIRITRLRVPQGLVGAEVHVNVAGRDTMVVFPAAQYQTFHYRWDGRDAYGRLTSGRHKAGYSVAYVYPLEYFVDLGAGSLGFGRYCWRVVDNQFVSCLTGGSPSSQRLVRAWVSRSVWLGPLSAWNALWQGIGGWSLDAHHAYDAGGRLLYLGTGERVEARDIRRARLVAGGSGTPGGNGGPATVAGFANLADIIAAPDGGFYVADPDDHTVRRVRADGSIEAFAGISGSPGFSGDGDSATAAELSVPRGLALGSDGSVYIVDGGNYRVRRVTPQGIIETFAGTGNDGFSGDGGPADSADLSFLVAVTAAPDGSVYIADLGDTNRVRKVSTDGRIETIAGSGTDEGTCHNDTIPAVATCLATIRDLAWGPNGALYVLENRTLRRIDPDGTTKRIAGDTDANCSTEPGDGGPALEAGLCATSVAIAPTGAIYLADNADYLRVIDESGIIRRFASGACAFDGPIEITFDPTPIVTAPTALVLPSAMEVNSPCLSAVALAPDGGVLVTDPASDPDTNRVHRLEAALPGLSLSSLVVAAPDGSEVYLFNPDGRHLETRDALTGATTLTFAYDSAGRLVTVTDVDSNVTTIERNGAGTPTAIVGPFGQETALDIDSLGYLTTVTNPAGEVVRVSHNALGLLQHLVNPLGDTTAFTYDNDGLLMRDDDAAGGFTELERGALGTDSTSMDSSVVTMTTAEGRATRYEVAQLGTGEGRRTVSPAGLATTAVITRNGKGLEQTTTVTPDSMITTVTTRRDPRFPQTTVLDSMQIKAPGEGELRTEVLGRRHVVLSDPDDPLSLVSQTDSVTVNNHTTVSVYTASTKTQLTTTPEGRQFLTRLDSVGRIIRARAANLDSVIFSYDSRGRLEEQQQGGRVVSYDYDPGHGRLASVTDPIGRVTQFEYDSSGRVTTQLRPDSSEILLAYDSAGNLTSLTPPGRPAHSYQYNALGLVTKYDPPLIGDSAKPTKYFYNLDRQLDSIVRPDSIVVVQSYDAAGRPNGVSFDRGTLTLGYSGTTGNLNRIRTPEGDSLLFTYDGALPTQVRWSGTVEGTVGVVYDNDLRVASYTVDGTDTIHFNYDNDGLLIGAGDLTLGRSAANGMLLADTLGPVHSAYQYSSRGELNGYRVKHDATTLFATGYVRDSLGRIAQLFDTTQGTAKRWSFVYDSLGRLAKDSIDGAVFHVFTYDSNGNRLSYTSGAGTVNYSYDNQDRLLWSRVGTDTTHYAYSSNGELRAKVAPGADTTTYSYDALGNLISVVLPDETEIEYVIDGQNRRVGRKVGGDLVKGWLYQNQLNPIAELDSAGNVVSRFVYGTRANVPAYMLRGDSVFRLVTDHLGSVRLVVDTGSGTVVQRLDYDEWGNITTNTNLSCTGSGGQ